MVLPKPSARHTTPYSGRHWVVEYPGAQEWTVARLDSLRDYLGDFELSLYTDPAATVARRRMDVASFTDVILLNELARNHDSFLSSTFVFRNRGGLLHLAGDFMKPRRG